jgi:hypothetical protein
MTQNSVCNWTPKPGKGKNNSHGKVASVFMG